MTEPPPWRSRAAAVGAGADPGSFGDRAVRARRRDAGLGRSVEVPAYLVPVGPVSGVTRAAAGAQPVGPLVASVVLSCAPGGRLGQTGRSGLVDAERRRLCEGVGSAAFTAGAAEPVTDDPGWTRVLLPAGARRTPTRMVLRDSDWELLVEWSRLRFPSAAPPRDAPLSRVLARHLAHIDLGAGTGVGAGGDPVDDWGSVYLEARSDRVPDRVADTLTLGWRAYSRLHGYQVGEGDAQLLSDLGQRRFRLPGGTFRVRELPPWERPEAVGLLHLPTAASVTWSMDPLTHVLACFADGPPVPDGIGVQDA